MIDTYIAQLEGKKVMLYEDGSNPYESIYIRMEIKDGKLTVHDDECEHGPDGGWSWRWFEFDSENTRKVFAWLCEGGRNPVAVMTNMVGYEQRLSLFKQGCQERGIEFESYWGF